MRVFPGPPPLELPPLWQRQPCCGRCSTRLPHRSVARRPPRYAGQAAAGTYDVGLRLTDERTGGTLAYVPAAGAVDDAVRSIAAGAGLLLFDGTFWSDDELAEAGGTDAPSAREMGHLPVGGPEGSMQLLPRAGAQRTVLVHINNTNPMLGRSSAERAEEIGRAHV